MIVNRVIAGYPKKGLIWHFQGSGKSLLMVFAAQKLRMIPELKIQPLLLWMIALIWKRRLLQPLMHQTFRI